MIAKYFDFFDSLDILSKISIQIALILLLTFCASKVLNYVIFLIFKYIKKTDPKKDKGLILELKRTIIFLMWFYVFISITNLLFFVIDNDDVVEKLKKIRSGINFLIILIFLLRTITNIKNRYVYRKERFGLVPDYASIDAMEKLSKLIVIIIWGIVILGRVGLNLNALLAFGGAGGILVGFAGKDLMANIFGGLMIYLDKPFAVGDWIASADRQIEGDVEMIGWRQTRILSLEKFPIYIPNSLFGTIVIQNKSRLRSRLVQEDLYLRLSDTSVMDAITTDAMSMLKEHPGVNKKFKIYINFVGFSDKGMLKLRVYAFTNTIELVRFCEIRQDLLLKIVEIVRKHGGELAVPVKNIVGREYDNTTFDKEN